MRRVENFFPDALPAEGPRLLDATDWKRCVQDDCASWELFCLVHTDERSRDGVSPNPISIRVEFVGQADSFDRDRWRGLMETIERDFAYANYESELVSSSGPNGARPWKQWVITPRRPFIGVSPAQ
jgi:hypothetical protein